MPSFGALICLWKMYSHLEGDIYHSPSGRTCSTLWSSDLGFEFEGSG